MTDQVVNIVAGYFEEIRYRPVVQKLYYKKKSGRRSDLDLLVVQEKPILVEEKSTQPFVNFNIKFDDITTTKLHYIQSKLKNVLEKWSRNKLQKGWKKHFKEKVREFFPQKYQRKTEEGYVISALLMCFDRFHNPDDVKADQAEVIRRYVPKYTYPESEKWYITSDKYPENLKELFKTEFRSSCGKTRLIDELRNTNEILEEAKDKIKRDIKEYNKWVKIKNRSEIKGHYTYNNVAMELLRQQVISELLEKEGS